MDEGRFSISAPGLHLRLGIDAAPVVRAAGTASHTAILRAVSGHAKEAKVV